MSSLDIVARAVLMENGLFEAEEEGKWKRRGKKALKYGAVTAGLGGLGYAAIKGHRYMQGGGFPAIPAQYFGEGVPAMPNRYARLVAHIKDNSNMMRVGKIGLGAAGIGATGYGGYKLYKHIQAKRAAAKAAREAYYAVYNNLMEAEDTKPDFFTRHKWIRRGVKAGIAAGGLYGAHKGLSALAPGSYGKMTSEIGTNLRRRASKGLDKLGRELGKQSSKLSDVNFPPTGTEQFV